jgi:hypothetical protein
MRMMIALVVQRLSVYLTEFKPQHRSVALSVNFIGCSSA